MATIFINIKEGKDKFTEFVRRAAEGEFVIITYRGKPKAVLKAFQLDELLFEGIAGSLKKYAPSYVPLSKVREKIRKEIAQNAAEEGLPSRHKHHSKISS